MSTYENQKKIKELKKEVKKINKEYKYCLNTIDAFDSLERKYGYKNQNIQEIRKNLEDKKNTIESKLNLLKTELESIKNR